MAVQHSSSPEKLHYKLQRLPDSELQKVVEGSSSYASYLALCILQGRQKLRDAVAAGSAEPDPPTVAAEIAGRSDPEGVAGLPSPNMTYAAQGGIVNFAEGGVPSLPVELGVPREVASKIPLGINAARGAPTDRSMPEGVAGLPSPNMTYAAQGGIVNFAGGGSTKESVPSTSVLNAAQKKREARRVQRILEKQKEEIEKYRLEQLGASEYLRQLELQENYDRAYPLPPPKKKAQGGIVSFAEGGPAEGTLRDWLDKSRTKEHEEWLNYILQAESGTSLEKIRAMLDEQEGEELAGGAPTQMSRLGKLARLEGDSGQSIGPMQLKGPPGSILSTDKKGDIKVPEYKTDINASVRAAERHFENLLRLNDGNVEDSLRDYNQGRTSRRRGDKPGQTEKYMERWLAYNEPPAEEAGGPVSDAPRAAFGVPEEDLQETYRRQDKLPWSAYQHPRWIFQKGGPGRRPRIIGIVGGPGEAEPDTLLQREHEERRRIMQGAGEAVSDAPSSATPDVTRLSAINPNDPRLSPINRAVKLLRKSKEEEEERIAGRRAADAPSGATGPQKSGIARAAELLRESKKAEREAEEMAVGAPPGATPDVTPRPINHAVELFERDQQRRAQQAAAEEMAVGAPLRSSESPIQPGPLPIGRLVEGLDKTYKFLQQAQVGKEAGERAARTPPGSPEPPTQSLLTATGAGQTAQRMAESAKQRDKAKKAKVEAEDPLAGEDPNEPVFNQKRFEQMTKGEENLNSLSDEEQKSLQTTAEAKGISPIRLALILGGLKLMSGESLGDAAEKAVAAYIKSSEYEARRLKAYDKALREEAKEKATAKYRAETSARQEEALKLRKGAARRERAEDVVAGGALEGTFEEAAWRQIYSKFPDSRPENLRREKALENSIPGLVSAMKRAYIRTGRLPDDPDPIKSIQLLPQRMP